jgi:hypothetical protein
LSVEVVENLVGLFVGNHALVGAFHLVQEDDVNIGLCALSEAGWHYQAVEKVRVALDILELG